MNVNTILAALTLTLGAAAPGLAAAAPTTQDQMPMSRVEVHADMASNRIGYAARGEAYSASIPVSTHSRSQVVAELQAARADGALDQRTELYGSFRAGDIRSTLTRSEVMATSIDQNRYEQQYTGA